MAKNVLDGIIPLEYQNHFDIKGPDLHQFLFNLNRYVATPILDEQKKFGKEFSADKRFFYQWAFHNYTVSISKYYFIQIG
jgi:hypothetical protein